MLINKEILGILNAKINFDFLLNNCDFKNVCVDSKDVTSGDLFVAICGEKVDGHEFVEVALQRGASLAVVEKDIDIVDTSRLIKVDSTKNALTELARYNAQQIKIPYIGVTGSVGKTTTKNLIYHLLKKSTNQKIYVSRKNFNSQIGLPVCAASMPLDTKIGIFEMGMSEKGELKNLISIVTPTVSVITHICETHLEFFDSVWDIAKAKSEIMETEQVQEAIILPSDSAYTDWLIRKANRYGIKNIYTFGFSRSDAQVISCTRENDEIYVKAQILGNIVEYVIACHNVSVVPNSLSSILAAHVISNVPLQDIAEHVRSFEASSHRGEIIKKGNVTIVDDSYNACTTSMRSAITSLAEHQGRKVLIMGDMKELGKNSKRYHEILSATIDKFGIDLVFACGQYSQYLFNNLQEKKKGLWCKDSNELSEKIASFVQPGDKILVKGSNSMNMHKIVEVIYDAL
ncbi:MAG: UDP-N-acetylmuramoyl-tripeptide--D-alanyl-D-alanine ligase [Alphaproteobacteria bacterium]|nr:UDP-N-acetylmuramoyl-tripeptide--D-alanyl-D-alanine ligase [Alphaproteobacteria bacterium]